MQKFWNWSNEVSSDGSELILDGPISSETWWGDEVTPEVFRSELKQHTGDLTVILNSGGGDVFAGMSIYNALREYSGNVTVRVDGLAASIASIVAMSGDKIVMSPGSMMMIHKPWVMAMGDAKELAKSIEILDGIESSLISIYKARTGLSEEEVVALVEAETWMTAEEAVEKGFADEATPAKSSSLSDAINNAFGAKFAQASYLAAIKPSLQNFVEKVADTATEEIEAIKAKAEVVDVQEEAPAEPETTEEVEDPKPVEVKETPKEETQEEVTEPPVKKEVEEEIKMDPKDEAAKAGIVEPAKQATPEVKASKNYLKTKASVEDFAEVLKANAGKTAEDVKAAWKDVLVKNGLTDADYFRLPEPLISNIEDAVKASGIYNLLDHTGLDVFKVTWDDADEDIDTSRAGGHRKGDTKDEQVLDFDSRVIRAQYIYKYLVLDKETIRENRSTGALVRFVLNELPTRIIREIERAVVIGDGRATNNKRHIASFLSIKSDVVAENSFATEYVPAVGESRYETIVRALDLIEADGAVYIVSKKGYLTGLKLEQNVNGAYIFQPGADVSNAMGLAGQFEPTWFKDATDADYDAYLVVFNAYKTVGDNSIEAFTNFKLETNENEFLQEIYKGGALTGRISAVGIARVAGS